MLTCITHVFAFLALLCQTPASPPHRAVHQLNVPIEQLEWTRASWTNAPDTEIEKAETTVRSMYADSASHLIELNRYRDEYLQSPRDKAKLARWLYGSFIESLVTGKLAHDPKLREALETVKSPFTYASIRLRLLGEAGNNMLNDYHVALAERIIRVKPGDYDVLRALIRDTGGSDPKLEEAEKKRLEYIDRLIELNPNGPAGYQEKGSWYFWHAVKVASDKKASIEALKQYIYWAELAIAHEKRPARASYLQRARASIEQCRLVIEKGGFKTGPPSLSKQ